MGVAPYAKNVSAKLMCIKGEGDPECPGPKPPNPASGNIFKQTRTAKILGLSMFIWLPRMAHFEATLSQPIAATRMTTATTLSSE